MLIFWGLRVQGLGFRLDSWDDPRPIAAFALLPPLAQRDVSCRTFTAPTLGLLGERHFTNMNTSSTGGSASAVRLCSYFLLWGPLLGPGPRAYTLLFLAA